MIYKGAYQPVQKHRMVCAFVVHMQESQVFSRHGQYNDYFKLQIPSKHLKVSHYWLASETIFLRWANGGTPLHCYLGTFEVDVHVINKACLYATDHKVWFWKIWRHQIVLKEIGLIFNAKHPKFGTKFSLNLSVFLKQILN